MDITWCTVGRYYTFKWWFSDLLLLGLTQKQVASWNYSWNIPFGWTRCWTFTDGVKAPPLATVLLCWKEYTWGANIQPTAPLISCTSFANVRLRSASKLGKIARDNNCLNMFFTFNWQQLKKELPNLGTMDSMLLLLLSTSHLLSIVITVGNRLSEL